MRGHADDWNVPGLRIVLETPHGFPTIVVRHFEVRTSSRSRISLSRKLWNETCDRAQTPPADMRQEVTPFASSLPRSTALGSLCKPVGAVMTAEEVELTQATLAKCIIQQTRHGERDQRRLRDGALLHLANPI
jgi:hypothetical protein